ncbi:hypothetical protein J4433_00370 [Candidatus Pacearchaeota archaeon]|nr:hypothetical protein [Candidatus Pacearchaeota archaeon]
MVKILRSEYINISRVLIRKLYKSGCWGKGSLYEDELKDGFPQEEKGKVLVVAHALIKQGILCKKPKKYGFKYYLNMERKNKIDEILGLRKMQGKE